MADQIYYFGCWPGQIGHYLFGQVDGRVQHVWPYRIGCPWGDELDSGLLPKDDYWNRGKASYQPEGHGVLAQKDGWTCFSFWNRRFDQRYGSNSAFLIKAEVSFVQLLESAVVVFPEVFQALSGLMLDCKGERFAC